MRDPFRMKRAAATRVAAVAAASLVGLAVAAGLAGPAQAAAGSTASTSHQAGSYGDPAAAAPYWGLQHFSDCGEMAVADVVGQITGDEPTEKQITTVAENTPSVSRSGSVWQPKGSTKNGDLPVLLAHYGIHAVEVHTTTGDLEQDLAQGHQVIVGLNNQILWNGSGNRTKENHFVVVTGVDAQAGVVHLNDSGTKNGRDEQVSLATFQKAWATSNNVAVVTR
jgi:Peptidase_C39 like family